MSNVWHHGSVHLGAQLCSDPSHDGSDEFLGPRFARLIWLLTQIQPESSWWKAADDRNQWWGVANHRQQRHQKHWVCNSCSGAEATLIGPSIPTPVFLPGESQGRRSLVGCIVQSMESHRVGHDWSGLAAAAAAATAQNDTSYFLSSRPITLLFPRIYVNIVTLLQRADITGF